MRCNFFPDLEVTLRSRLFSCWEPRGTSELQGDWISAGCFRPRDEFEVGVLFAMTPRTPRGRVYFFVCAYLKLARALGWRS